MLDALDRFAQKRLDQQRLGFRRRNAARHQIEFQLLVERAGGGAVTALHVVGENFKLRLVVGLRTLGQKQRLRHHLGVGLLRAVAHDDAALEHAVGLAVEHGLEHLAALAAARDVVGDERRIGVLAVLDQRSAADAGHGVLAVEVQEDLVAHHRAADREGKRVEARARRRPPPRASRRAARRRLRRRS